MSREGVERGEARDELVVDESTEPEAADDESADKSAPLGKPLADDRQRREVRHAGANASDEAVSQIQPGRAEPGRAEPGEHVADSPQGDARHCDASRALTVQPESADDHAHGRQGKIRDRVSPCGGRQVFSRSRRGVVRQILPTRPPYR